MVHCDRCLTPFKFKCHLKRHLNRKIPCVSAVTGLSLNDANASKSEVNDSNASKSEVNVFNEVLLPFKCMYCCKRCSRLQTHKAHEYSCKLKNDYVRKLELKLEKPCFEYLGKTCRFCKHVSTQSCNLTRHLLNCKSKMNYEKELEAELEAKLETELEEKIKLENRLQHCYERCFNI